MTPLTAIAVADLIVAALDDGHTEAWQHRHIDIINARKRQLGLSSADLSTQARIPRNALARILHGHRSPTLAQVADLCRALDIRLEPPTVDRSGL